MQDGASPGSQSPFSESQAAPEPQASHGPGRGPLRTIALWMVLLLIAGLLAAAQSLLPEVEEEPLRDDPSLRFLSRYVFGAAQLLKSLPQSEATVDQLAQSLEEGAKSEVDRLRMASVLAELRGADAALEELTRLSESGSQELAEDLGHLIRVYQEGSDSLDAQTQDRLIERHGWYARLALSFDKPPSDPLRRSVRSPALRAAAAAAAAVAAVGIAVPVGLILFSIAFMRRRKGQLKMRNAGSLNRYRGGSGLLLEAFVVYLIAFILLSVVGVMLDAITGLSLFAWLAGWPVLLVALWPAARGMELQRLKEALGWYRGDGFLREAGYGLVGYLAGFPIILLGILGAGVLARLTDDSGAHPLALELASAPTWRMLQIFSIGCLLAPLSEELMFRGALYSHLRMKLHYVVSGLITGLIFAAIHPQGLVGIPVLAAVGLALALIREWRGSIIGPIVAHAAHNFSALTLVILFFG